MGTLSLGADAFLHSLIRSPGIRLSTLGSHSPGPQEVPLVIRSSVDPDRSLLASEALVSGPSRSDGGQSCGSSFMSRSAQTASLPSSSSQDPQAVSSCLETLQRFARAEGFSACVAAQVGFVRRCSSWMNYQIKWSIYSRWCRSEGHTISRPSLPKVADFLFWLRRSKNLSVSSILGYHSMLSAVVRFKLPGISSDPVLRDLIHSFKMKAPPCPVRPPAWVLWLFNFPVGSFESKTRRSWGARVSEIGVLDPIS